MTLTAFCAHALFNVPIVPARTLKVLGKVHENATQLGTVPDSMCRKSIENMKSNDAFFAAYFCNVRNSLEIA